MNKASVVGFAVLPDGKRLSKDYPELRNKVIDLCQEAYENHGYLPMMIGSLHIEWINHFIDKGEKSE